jgi:hypothetical protein
VERYTSLMIDIKNSRKYDGEIRNSIQFYTKDCINCLNKAFKPSLAKEVMFSAGDELQGLFHTTQGAILYLNLLEIFLAPIEVRAGIGIGEWSVIIEQGPSTEQDGSAYHNSRAALNYSHKSQINNVCVFSGNHKNEFLTSSINISNALIGRQTDLQNIITMVIELVYPLIYRDEIDFTEYKGLFHLIDKKIELLPILNMNKYYNRTQLPQINMNRMMIREPAVISEADGEIEDIIWKWGTVTNLAELLNKSRQSIDKSIKVGRVIQIRYSKAVSLLMAEKFRR